MSSLSDFQLRIDEICWALDAFQKSPPKGKLLPKTSDGKLYSDALEALNTDPRAEPLELLRGAEFKPFLLMNGLIFFSSLKPEFREQILQVLSTSLKEFRYYYGSKAGLTLQPPDAHQERRWMAFLLAYLPAAGMDLLGIMMTLKGDCALQETKSALQEILEGNEHTLRHSRLFPEAERSLLQEILESNSPTSWKNLRLHLVKTYALPQLTMKPFKSGPLHCCCEG